MTEKPQQKLTPRQSLLASEGLACLLALAALSLAAVWYDLAPVGGMAKGAHAPAPWLFLGLQELLSWLPPRLAGLGLPLLGLALLALLPWLGRTSIANQPAGKRPVRPAEVVAWMVLLTGLGLTLVGALRQYAGG